MKNRIRLIQNEFLSAFQSLLITKDVDIAYLTGFPASESWLLITKHKSFYITDARYTLEARKGLPSFVSLKEYKGSFSKELLNLLSVHKIKTLGLDSRHISYAQFMALKQAVKLTCQCVERNSIVEYFREIKEKEEILKIRHALKIHHQALKYIKSYIKPGNTERQVLLKLENFVKIRGVDFSFSPIIASGPNSCFPHAKVTDRKIRNNEAVLLDMGIDYKGYKSDLTRMFYLGKIPNLICQVDGFVRDAQRKAIEHIHPGVKASDVDYQARNYLKSQRLDKYFGHSLGHGVGLEIHESPRLAQTSTSILKPGMVVTVEPAVYLPHKFGIRIEDMVLVTQKGKEVLSDNIN